MGNLTELYDLDNEEKIKELIEQRRRQILIHSCIYYYLNDNIVPDKKFDQWGYELVELQKEYPDIAKTVPLYEAFADWDGSTGMDLPIREPSVVSKAKELLQMYGTKKSQPAQQSKIKLKGNAFETYMQAILDDVIKKEELPPKVLHLIPIRDKDSVKGQSVYIYEPEYPPVPGEKDEDDLTRNYFVLRISSAAKNRIRLVVSESAYGDLEKPASIEVIQNKTDKDTGLVQIIFTRDDTELEKYIRKIIDYCLADYTPQHRFGCCNLFIECSNAKKCVHSNPLYSMGCMYRKNLEAGHIFYGVNKNI